MHNTSVPSSSRSAYPYISLSRSFLYLSIFSFLLLFFSFVPPIPHVYLSRLPPSAPVSVTASPRSQSIRVLSLNTFIRPFLIGVSDYKDQRLQRLLPYLRSYDLICFQELFWTTGSRKKQFLDQLINHASFIYQTSSPVPALSGLLRWPPKFIDAGLVILSKYPIIKAQYYTFSDAVGKSVDYVVAKGVLYARIGLFADAPERTVHVFTLHLQASNGLDDVAFKEVRATQLQELVLFVRDMIKDDPEAMVILAGDFNVDGRRGFDDSSSSDEYKRAVDILSGINKGGNLRDLLYENNNFSHPVTSAGGIKEWHQKNERLDYVFLLQNQADTQITAREVEGSVGVNEFRVGRMGEGKPFDTLSDHYGVQAEIRFDERGYEGER